ncbi:ABC transporter permease [Leucobacter rhizosphaerae]|uniref:ABC transporter permease n=1 Tax=Leucobacter rhizosphaerae TaxID=2932245 RepID=A0ABY4FSJ1_9MICO|nr:ABC transporter permease [Leucobacter rhizosphaerae]UOQ59236.1 ABC transporter permease [Leucobacter rhizosphaerae]
MTLTQSINIGRAERKETIKSVGLPLVAIVFLLVLFSILSPNFLQASTFVTILRESSVLLVVAVGMTLVIIQGSIDLSVGATVSLAGLVAASVTKETNAFVAVIAALAVGLVVGLINGLIFAYGKVPSFLVTLGMSMVVGGIGTWLVNGRPVQVSDGGLRWISQSQLLLGIPTLVIWALVVWLIFSFIGMKTRFGRYAFAIGGAEAVSSLAGIPNRRVKLWALTIAGLCAAIAGILLTSRIGAATPGMGDRLTLDAIAAVVMGGTAITGGVGGVQRTVLGVLVITILSVGLNSMGVQPYMQAIIQGLVVVAAVALTLDRAKLTVIK